MGWSGRVIGTASAANQSKCSFTLPPHLGYDEVTLFTAGAGQVDHTLVGGTREDRRGDPGTVLLRAAEAVLVGRVS